MTMIPVTIVPESQMRTLLAMAGVIWGTRETARERVTVAVKGNEEVLEYIWESCAASAAETVLKGKTQ